MQQRPDVLLLSLKGNEVQRQSPYIFSMVSDGPDEKTSFYVLLESVRPDDERICNITAELLRVLLAKCKGSLTASLSAVIKETHQRLYHFNQQRPSAERSGVGITCLALRGKDIFVAAAGPAFAYLFENGKLRQITNPKEGGMSSLSGVGTGSKADVQLFYYTLEPADRIFLATSSLRRSLSERGLLALLSQDREDYESSLRELSKTLPYLSTIRLEVPSPEKAHNNKKGFNIGEATAAAKAVTKARLPKLAGKEVTIPIAGSGKAKQKHSRGVALREAMQHLLPNQDEPQVRQLDSAPKADKASPAGKAIKDKPSPFLRKLRIPLLILAVFLALLIGIQMLLLYPSFANKQAEASFTTLLTRAQSSYDAAWNKDDKAERRRLLLEADKLASDALEKRKDDVRAMDMRQTIASDLNVLDAVQNLPGLKVLEDYGRIGSGSSVLTEIVINEESVFVFDKGMDRIYGSILNSARSAILPDSTKILLKKDDKYEGTQVSTLTAMFWMPAGGARPNGNLVVMDDRHSLFEYTAGKGASLLKLRGADAWSSFKGALGYNGDLYVLDPRANQVWRYIPTASGYDSERRGILENGTIPDAVDITIDGSVYVLGSTGTIWKFSDGVQQPFSQAGIDKNLVNPTSLYTSSTARYIYVVDPGNRRIVVFNKNGTFYRQYVNEAFDSLRSVYADEEKAKLYILNGKKVYIATIPR